MSIKGTQGSQQLFEDIRAAKEFADAYGVELLDRILRLAETGQNPLQAQTFPSNTSKTEAAGILQEAKNAGFKVNSWLGDLILSSHVEVVRDAIAVVKDNVQRGVLVQNPEGLLVAAIRNQWKPSNIG